MSPFMELQISPDHKVCIRIEEIKSLNFKWSISPLGNQMYQVILETQEPFGMTQRPEIKINFNDRRIGEKEFQRIAKVLTEYYENSLGS